MKPEERLLCDYMVDFFQDNFNKITYNLSDSNLPTQKDKFISKIRNNYQIAAWSLLELANWGMDKEYLKELFVKLPDDSDFVIVKLDSKYLKIYCNNNYNYKITFVKPKIKTVIYYE